MIPVAMFIRLPRLSVLELQESSRWALQGSLQHFCASNKSPYVDKVLRSNSSSFSQLAALLASHCNFDEGSGSIRKSSTGLQYNPLLTLMIWLRRNQAHVVLTSLVSQVIIRGKGVCLCDAYLRRDSAKIQSSHVRLGCDSSS
jgi:hypothetical protein